MNKNNNKRNKDNSNNTDEIYIYIYIYIYVYIYMRIIKAQVGRRSSYLREPTLVDVWPRSDSRDMISSGRTCALTP